MTYLLTDPGGLVFLAAWTVAGAMIARKIYRTIRQSLGSL